MTEAAAPEAMQPTASAAAPNAWASGPDATPVDQVAILQADPDFVASLTNPFHPLHRQASARWDAAHAYAFAAEKGAAAQQAAGNDAPPVEATEYVLPAPPIGVAAMTEEDAAEWRSLAHVAGLTADDVQFFTVGAYTAARDGADALDRDTHMRALAQRHGGAEGAAAVVAKARSAIAALPAAQCAQATDWLESSGLGNSVHVIERLALIADRRKGARK